MATKLKSVMLNISLPPSSLRRRKAKIMAIR